jgi:2-dehydropantoate 2-reductase
MSRFRSIAVVGAGAVGSFYGAMLARAGSRVTLIGRAAHVQAIEHGGLRLDMAGRVEVVRTAASTELSAVRGADLVLFCVKSTDTESVAREMAAHLAPGAVVLSLQNGVDNAPAIARQAGVPAGAGAGRTGRAADAGGDNAGPTVVPAVVYVATAMPEPGTVKHFGRGDLVIGPLAAADADDATTSALLQDLVALFGAAGIAVTVSRDVMAELWSKLMVNCAYNAISAIAQAPYARLAALPAIRDIQHDVVREVVAVANADGVGLKLEAALQAMERIAVAMPAQYSSTAQDVARRKPSEIDHLNGYVARRGRELGVPVPINATLHALVKLIESGYAFRHGQDA